MFGLAWKGLLPFDWRRSLVRASSDAVVVEAGGGVSARAIVDQLARSRWAPLGALTTMLVALAAVDVWWLASFRRGFPLTTDEAGYMGFAFQETNAFRYSGWSLDALWHAFDTSRRIAPLVPTLTVIPNLLFGKSIMVSLLVQVAFFVLLGLATYGIARRLVSRAPALLAAAVVSSIPGVADFSRAYYFVMGSAALFTAAIYAQLQSDGLRRRGWAVAWGVLIGLTALSRTMMPAFLPSLVLAGIMQATLLSGHRSRRLLNFGLGVGFALGTAAIWYVDNWRYVYQYLTSYGYGSNSTYYGADHPKLSWAYWLAEVRDVAQKYLYAPLTFALIACLLVGAVALLLRWRRRLKEGLLSFLRSDALIPAIVVLEGYVALTSSRNKGLGFPVPLLPALVVLSVAVLWQMPLRPLRAALATILLAIAGFNVLIRANVFSALDTPRDVTVPVLGSVSTTNGHADINGYVNALARYPVGYGARLPAMHRGWLPAENRLTEWLHGFSSTHATMNVVFATRDPLFDTNGLLLASTLYGHQPLYAGQIGAEFGGDRIAAYRQQLANANVLITADRAAPGSFPPYVTLARVAQAALSLGFRRVWTLPLPDGRNAEVWVLQGGA